MTPLHFYNLFSNSSLQPAVVEKLCNELHEHGLLRENDGEDLTYDVINKLSYTNLVVREILRLSPPIGGAFRKALRTFEIGVRDWSLITGRGGATKPEGGST